jgi:hypothetical protein
MTNSIYEAQLNYEQASEDFDAWIEQQGILLTEKQMGKEVLERPTK